MSNLGPIIRRVCESTACRATVFVRHLWSIARLLALCLAGCGQPTDSPDRADKLSLKSGADNATAISPSHQPSEVQRTAQGNKLPRYELRIGSKELHELDRTVFSDQTQPAIFVAEGKEYPVKVRYRGAWARTWPKKALKIFFASGQTLQGNHCLNLNSAWRDPAFVREPLAYQIYAACGVPAPASRMVQLSVNGEFYGLFVEVEQPGKLFLERHNLKGASIYKANSHANRADERDLGNEQSYSAHYEKENRKAAGYRELQLFCHELATATNTFEFFINRVDVEKYISYLAANALVQNWDCFNKNHFLVHDDPGSQKWFAVAWDLDRTFGDHWHGSFDNAQLPLLHGTQPLPGPTGWNRMANRFLGDTTLRIRFLDRLEELLEKEFTKQKLFPVLDQFESQIAPEAARDRARWPGATADLHSGIAGVKSYIERRRSYLLREVARMRRQS
ncbi:MAG: CotH kinase family protein [Verrucomicrobiota bacterium]